MKLLRAWVLIASVALAQSQPNPTVAPTLSDLGISYPLSSDWVLATTLMRNQAAAKNFSSETVLLAAVYAPQKKTLSPSSPFFSLLAFHDAHPDCQRFLDAMSGQLENQEKARINKRNEQMSVGGRDYYRMDFEQKGFLRHRSFICTAVKGYRLVWNAGAKDEKGLEAVAGTLNSIAPMAGGPDPVEPRPQIGSGVQGSSPSAGGTVETVTVASGVSSGLLIKKVAPVYPQEARMARIQGTVLLTAGISEEGEIVNLELIGGPIELAGSAVNAVRQWKYRPYLVNGVPVAVRTEIRVNYQLAGY